MGVEKLCILIVVNFLYDLRKIALVLVLKIGTAAIKGIYMC